jgi:hypothetical protein
VLVDPKLLVCTRLFLISLGLPSGTGVVRRAIQSSTKFAEAASMSHGKEHKMLCWKLSKSATEAVSLAKRSRSVWTTRISD